MGEILNFTQTQANTDDKVPLKNKSFIKKLFTFWYQSGESFQIIIKMCLLAG
jgi:hypothetical protein